MEQDIDVPAAEAVEEEQITLKEYWNHVGELLKYFFKYFGIAIKETFVRGWSGAMLWARKHRLVNEIDEDGNIIDYEEDEDLLEDEFDDEEPVTETASQQSDEPDKKPGFTFDFDDESIGTDTFGEQNVPYAECTVP